MFQFHRTPPSFWITLRRRSVACLSVLVDCSLPGRAHVSWFLLLFLTLPLSLCPSPLCKVLRTAASAQRGLVRGRSWTCRPVQWWSRVPVSPAADGSLELVPEPHGWLADCAPCHTFSLTLGSLPSENFVSGQGPQCGLWRGLLTWIVVPFNFLRLDNEECCYMSVWKIDYMTC